MMFEDEIQKLLNNFLLKKVLDYKIESLIQFYFFQALKNGNRSIWIEITKKRFSERLKIFRTFSWGLSVKDFLVFCDT